ncbi:MAG: YtxH domain-containing protein [Fimbriimonadaceae bacterium]|jgi:gas vesicle protein|nr:YtxH domain-containing protein [Fimbriimonadaceae bacterium]
MNENNDKNALVYLLAGFGLGALIGALAGLLFAPKAGTETRDELATRAKDIKGKTEEWIAEQRAKRHATKHSSEEVGA